MKRVLAVLLTCCAFLPGGSGETGRRTAGMDPVILKRIPERMQSFVAAHAVAGTVTMVMRHGQVTEFDAEGMADIESKRPMRKDTIFQIMSMTKPFTAVGIMMLAEEGKLTPRDPVERHLPEFQGQRVITPNGTEAGRLGQPEHAITIRDLMTHTSGVMDAAPGEVSGYSQRMHVPLADLVKVFAKQPLLFQPGTHWSYSSPGIDILGRIIEVCSGQKYEDFIAQRILEPLGMKDSFYFPPADKIERIAMVYESNQGVLRRSPGTILGGDPALHRQGAVYSAPGWGLYSTAEDLSRFYSMMLAGGVAGGKRYLSKASVRMMTTVQTGDLHPSGWLGGSGYGLAWEIVKDPYGELAGHTVGSYGHGGAFGTEGWMDPNRDLIRILLVQSSNGGVQPVRDTFLTLSSSAVVD